MTFSKKQLMIGGAAIVIAGVGLTAGLLLSGGHPSHLGETPEQHAAELGATATQVADHDEHAGEEGGHAEEGGEEHAEGEVDIDEKAIEMAGIGLITIAPGSLGAEITAQATVAASPTGEAILTARASGAITDIRKRLGDPVSRGETVAVVLSPDASALSASLTSAKSRLDSRAQASSVRRHSSIRRSHPVRTWRELNPSWRRPKPSTVVVNRPRVLRV